MLYSVTPGTPGLLMAELEGSLLLEPVNGITDGESATMFLFPGM